MKYEIINCLLFISVILCSCQKQRTESIIARAGNATLTMEKLRMYIDTAKDNPSGQIRDYVSYWTNNEIVYQEAKRNGFENSTEVKQQLEEVKKQLMIQAFLEHRTFYDTSALNEKALHDYFAAHESEFYFREDMIKLNMAVFYDREHASAFAAAVSRGKTWDGVAQEFLKNNSTTTGMVSSTTGQLFSQSTIFPPEIWKVAMSTGIKEVTFPIKAGISFYVLQPLAIFRQGSPADFDFVKDEVRQRLSIDLRKKGYNEMLSELRKRYKVEIYLPSDSTTDTLQKKHYE